MNKYEFVKAISEKTGNTQVQTEAFLVAFQLTIQEQLAAGEQVSLKGFGTFKRQERKARVGINPKTGGKVNIPAKNQAKLKFSKEFAV